MTHFVCALVLAADVWFVHSTIKIATALRLAPGMEFLLCNFYFTNNFLLHRLKQMLNFIMTFLILGPFRGLSSPIPNFWILFITFFFNFSKCIMDCVRVEDLQVLKECCSWKHCDLLANESPHRAETESGCHPSRAKPLWGGKLVSERLAAIFRVHRSIRTISNYCFRKFWLTLNP